MLAEIIRGDDFNGLKNYLTGIAKQLGPDDIEIRNLVSSDTAADEMRLSARRSSRVQMPVYHLVLTWHEDEHPTPAQQFAMAHELIERIGLGDYQALLVRHHEPKGGATPGRGRHYEVHVLLNRVGPNGRTAEMSHDYAIVEKAVADIARKWGMRCVPGRFNGLGEGIAFEGSSDAARSFTAATGVQTVAGEIRASSEKMALLVQARQAKSWPLLLKTFESLGVTVSMSNRIAKKGQTAGLVLTSKADPKRSEKISALDGDGRKWGLPSLCKELGPLPPFDRAAGFHSVIVAHPEPSSRLGFAAFEKARQDVLDQRRELSTLQRQVKKALRRSHSAERRKVMAARDLRRKKIRLFFGRGSPTATALNHGFDANTNVRLKALRAEQRDEISKLEMKSRAEIERFPIITWNDWQRAETKSANGTSELQSGDDTRSRADIDVEVSTRPGFGFKSIPNSDRHLYAKLIQSSLFTSDGADPGPIVDRLLPVKVARFMAWYERASDSQRATVQSWGKPVNVGKEASRSHRVDRGAGR